MSMNGIGNTVMIAAPINKYGILCSSSRSFFSITISVRIGRENITAENWLEGIKGNCDILSLVDRSVRGFLQPFTGSVAGGHETRIFVNQLLSDVLSELKKDAITVYTPLC
jgi:hypothetical protein